MYTISKLTWTQDGLKREVYAETTHKKTATEFLKNQCKADPEGCYVITWQKGAKNGEKTSS